MKFHSKSVFLFIVSFWICQLPGQNLPDILQANLPFAKIVQQADLYFQDKHPGKTAKDLTRGQHRDGEFVKYQRWKAYWQHYQTEEGYLKSISHYYLEAEKEKNPLHKSLGFFDQVPWSNISNDTDLGVQIGLGRTTSLGFHPTNTNIFYVGTAFGGIWKTSDGGTTYTQLGDDLPTLSVSAVIVDRNNLNTLYIALSDMVWYGPPALGVYKSTDGGDTWSPTALNFALGNGIRIFVMRAHPTLPGTMFVGTDDGLYRTTDGFQSVFKINTENTRDIQFNTGNPSIMYQTSESGKFLKSVNGGSSFSLVKTLSGDGGIVRIATTPQNVNHLFVSKGDQLHESLDGGDTFSAVSTLDNKNPVLHIDPQNEQTLLHGNFEYYRSDDGGKNFGKVTDWLGRNSLPLIHVDQRNAFINPLQPRLVYLCNDGGIYTFNLDNNTFSNLSNGLIITQYYDIAVAQSNPSIVSGGTQDNGSTFRNNQGSWQPFAATGDGMNTEIDPTDDNIRYWEYQNGAMRRWQNGSNKNISPPGEDGEGAWETPYKLDPNDADRIVVGYKQVYVSDDQGDSWASISGELVENRKLNQLAIAPSNSNRIYATYFNQLFVKDINNNTWTKKTTPVFFGITDLEVDPYDMNTLYISYSGYSDGNKVFKSTDAGDTWANLSGSLPNVPVGALEIYSSIAGGVFVGTDAGVFYRDHSLQDWELYGTLPHTRVADIEVQYGAEKVVIGTHGRGIFEAPAPGSLCNTLTVNFINPGCQAVELVWDNNGSLVSYGTIPAGGSNIQNTTAGHRWLFRMGGSTQATYTANCLNREYTIDIGNCGTGCSAVQASFTNTGCQTAEVIWDNNGTLVSYGTVNANATFNIGTFEGHKWLFKVGSQTLASYTASCNISTFSFSASGCGTHATFPVEWISFEAEQKDADAVLTWVTARETNADFYGIEKSFDGFVFQQIGQVRAAGNTQQISSYAFSDERIAYSAHQKIFYRLRQVDRNGTYSYSKVLELDLTPSLDNLWIEASPVPVDQQLQISYHMAEHFPYGKISVLSSLGQSVFEQVLSDHQGRIDVEVQNWANGPYYVKIESQGVQKVLKILVSHK